MKDTKMKDTDILLTQSSEPNKTTNITMITLEKEKTYKVEVIEHISRFVICTVEASSEEAAREEALYGESTCKTVPHSESIHDREVWEVKAEGSE